MGTHQSDESVFNMAQAYLERINIILYKCQDAARQQNLDAWRMELRALWRELSIKVKPEEEATILGNFDKRINMQTLLDNKITSEEATFLNIDLIANNPELKSRYKTIVFFLLDKLEVKMRRLLQAKNMLLPSRSDPRFAVLER